MKKAKIFENFGLKVLAVFISILLWLVVINVSDPVISTPYSDIPIVVTNADSVTSAGKVYELTSSPTVTINVSAKRSILDSLSEDNFKAVVDLKEYDAQTGTVPIRVESNKYSDKIESMKSKNETADVRIEDMLRKQFVITPVVSGDPEEGYVTGDVSTAENIVRISGAESVVSAIRKVTAEVSVEGLSSSINTSVDLRLYDEDGELIKDSTLTKNISTVAISVQILATKELPLKFSASGVPAEGYCISGDLQADRENVLVAGKAAALNNISALDISSAAVSVEGADKDVEVTVDLTKYLPDGLTLVDAEETKLVTVTVPIEAILRKEFEVKKKDIRMQGLPGELEAEYTGTVQSLNIEVEGTASRINDLTIDDLGVTIDWDAYVNMQKLDALTEGTYRVPITLELPDGVSPVREILVSVRLTEKEK